MNITRTLLILPLLLLLSACTSRGPINTPHFDSRFTSVISEQENILLYSACELRAGTYMEGEIKMVPSYQGLMLLTNEFIRFLSWDAKAEVYRIEMELPYHQLLQSKYEFNTLISSFVAIRARNGEAYAFMIADEMVKITYRFLLMGQAGHLKVPS